MYDREVRPLKEDLDGLGFSDRTPGGPASFKSMVGLMDVEFIPTEGAASDGALTEDRKPGADAAAVDPIDGPVVTEETLECVGAILAHDMTESCDADVDIESMDEAQVAQLAAVVEQRLADLQQVVDEMADKQVPDALVERTQETMARVLDEMKKVRILGGKVTRVNVRKGSKAMKQRRKARIEYKKHKAKIKLTRVKRSRKAGSKIKAAKTARKHASMGGALAGLAHKAGAGIKAAVGKVKKAIGGGLVKHESDLAARLASLLDEGAAEQRSEGQRVRDELMESIGNVLLLIEWITQDDEAVEVLGEEYERLADEFCGGALTEAKADDAAFLARIAPIARAIGACVEELEKNVGRLA